MRRLSRQRDEASRIIAPFLQGQVSQYLVLRFILLYIVVGLWGLVEDKLQRAYTGALASARSVFHVDLNRPWIVIPVVLLQQLPKVVTGLYFLHWPCRSL